MSRIERFNCIIFGICSGSVSDAESSNESESDEDVNMDTASRPTLQVSGGFKWTVGEGTDPEDTVGGTPESLRGSDDSEEDEDLENIEVRLIIFVG